MLALKGAVRNLYLSKREQSECDIFAFIEAFEPRYISIRGAKAFHIYGLNNRMEYNPEYVAWTRDYPGDPPPSVWITHGEFVEGELLSVELYK